MGRYLGSRPGVNMLDSFCRITGIDAVSGVPSWTSNDHPKWLSVAV